MSRIRLAAVALTATTLAASGCGGSTRLLTKAELIAKADAICMRVNAKRASATISTPQDYARVLPPQAAYEQAALAELGKLTPPASMANDWKQIVVDAQTVANNNARLGKYRVGNHRRVKHVPPNNVNGPERALYAASVEAVQQMLAIAKRNGFNDCAQT